MLGFLSPFPARTYYSVRAGFGEGLGEVILLPRGLKKSHEVSVFFRLILIFN